MAKLRFKDEAALVEVPAGSRIAEVRTFESDGREFVEILIEERPTAVKNLGAITPQR